MLIASGMMEIAEPPSVVANGIVAALHSGNFHVFPDTMAMQIEGAYQNFAENIIEANIMGG